MMIPRVESFAASAACVKPSYVVTPRPEPADLDHGRIVKVLGGEVIRVRGHHREAAGKLGGGA